jgi:HlyD family secretion protein
VIVAAVGVYLFWFRGPTVRADLVTDKVEYRDLQLKVVERGTLEAKENHDIKCEVKAGSRGAPKIKWVVDNGKLVKAGDLLVDIDDSYLQEQATTQKIARDKAETDMITAKENYPILVSAIGLAEQNLEKWIKGDYPQTLHDLEGQVQNAESSVLQQEDRTAWVGRMVKKGYMTASQEEAEQATLTSLRLTLQKYQEQKKVLTDYTDPVNRQTFKNAIQDAKNKEQAGKATRDSAIAVFNQQDALYKDLLEQIKQCKVYAVHEGIVVYA